MVAAAERTPTPKDIDPYDWDRLGQEIIELGYEAVYPFDEVETTMTVMADYLKSAAHSPLPAVAITNHQTKGIGREGRIWHDKKGASILLTAGFRIKPESIGIFSDLVALTVQTTLQDRAENAQLQVKYPNDIIANGQKMAGLLVDHVYQEEENERVYKGTMVGIGINVHYSPLELTTFPTDYGATSLDQVTETVNTRQEIVVALLKAIKDVSIDAEVLMTNEDLRNRKNSKWRFTSAVLGRDVVIEREDEIALCGTVIDTQVGRGILVDDGFQKQWINYFDTHMKLRIQ